MIRRPSLFRKPNIRDTLMAYRHPRITVSHIVKRARAADHRLITVLVIAGGAYARFSGQTVDAVSELLEEAS